MVARFFLKFWSSSVEICTFASVRSKICTAIPNAPTRNVPAVIAFVGTTGKLQMVFAFAVNGPAPMYWPVESFSSRIFAIHTRVTLWVLRLFDIVAAEARADPQAVGLNGVVVFHVA